MQKHLIFVGVLACCFAMFALSPANAQPLPKFGVAVSAGSLGAGIEAATAVSRTTNLRFGYNYFRYDVSGTRSSDNISYNGRLRVESVEVLVDQYIKGPFHISSGALLYNGFQATGNVNVPSNQVFHLNDVAYTSAAGDPVTGTASIGARKIAPEVLFGFGNLLPRSARHFTFNADFGVAFQGQPNAKLNLGGSVCASGNVGCATVASQPAVQANIVAEQSKINSDLKPFQFYPIVRISFGVKF
jgi:hypothetical protein